MHPLHALMVFQRQARVDETILDHRGIFVLHQFEVVRQADYGCLLLKTLTCVCATGYCVVAFWKLTLPYTTGRYLLYQFSTF